MKIIFSLAIFLSAFLLFSVQPMLAKALLPLVGGAANVWTASMIVFQVLLLAGYGYAALSSRYLSPFGQSIAHVGLFVLAACLYLPLVLHGVNGITHTTPELWVLGMLCTTIGLPYFALSANSSMLQRWYHATYKKEPYHLFSASNAGSFIGLFAYPFFFEWQYTLPKQMDLWATGFVLMTLVLACFPLFLKRTTSSERQEFALLPRKQLAEVVFLAFIPSSLFLSTTLHVTSDIGAFPLLWIIPLALYLFSFIIVFASWGTRWITLAQTLHPLALLLLGASHLMQSHAFAIASNFIFFFIIAVSCHGALARLKPEPKALPVYFFFVSLGGALGGICNLIAPYIFNDLYEYYIVLVLSIFALPGKAELLARIRQHKASAALMTIVCVMIAVFYLQQDTKQTLLTERNFYGVSRITRDADFTYFEHGTTIHGIQARSGDTQHLTTYYAPVDTLLSAMPLSFFKQAIGVIGLGAGTIACAKGHGTAMEFFEINPQVITLAQKPAYFTFLEKCPARVIEGDGRLKLLQQPDGRYGLLVLDAFSSDSVPLHLLTREAFTIYKEKITANGFITINISSRYLDLAPFIAKVAEDVGFMPYKQFFPLTQTGATHGEQAATWLVILPQNSRWQALITQLGYTPLAASAHTPLWTDSYSNIVPAILW